MHRRLFVRHLATALAIPLLPIALPGSSLGAPLTALPSSLSALNRAAELVHTGQLGSLQTITVSRTYRPATATPTTLARLMEQDKQLLESLLRKDLTAHFSTVDPGDTSTPFGSQSHHFQVAGTTVCWQQLASFGNTPDGNTPERTPRSGSVHIAGSRGSMHINLSAMTFSAVDLNEPVALYQG